MPADDRHRPLLALTGSGQATAPPMPTNKCAPSFDHLVGAHEQHGRNFLSEGFRGLEIEHQFELGRLLHRQIGGLFTFDNPAHIRYPPGDTSVMLAHSSTRRPDVSPKVSIAGTAYRVASATNRSRMRRTLTITKAPILGTSGEWSSRCDRHRDRVGTP
jgi:hypothetical protein